MPAAKIAQQRSSLEAACGVASDHQTVILRHTLLVILSDVLARSGASVTTLGFRTTGASATRPVPYRWQHPRTMSGPGTCTSSYTAKSTTMLPVPGTNGIEKAVDSAERLTNPLGMRPRKLSERPCNEGGEGPAMRGATSVHAMACPVSVLAITFVLSVHEMTPTISVPSSPLMVTWESPDRGRGRVTGSPGLVAAYATSVPGTAEQHTLHQYRTSQTSTRYGSTGQHVA
eukprot:1196847-Rhodomonas_salina.2